MTNHISARLAWHSDGWNGHICKNPVANTYCSGQHSYPGNTIAERRDLTVLKWEQTNAGKSCASLSDIAPCIYSVNAFGAEKLTAFTDPPAFFRDGTKQKRWELPPATTCIWPYEEMFSAEVKKGNSFDNDKRLEKARQYFTRIEEDKSLVFYYANYSNPFSEDENQHYVLVGLSRIKKVGEILFYEDTSAETKRRFGGAYVWQCNITSHYPNEGFRIPYHLYADQPEILEKMLLTPDNPRNFKFGTRMFSDDESLDLVERFLEIAAFLKEKGDTSENWTIRIEWLQKLIAELWQCRGLYPGFPRILDYLGFTEAIQFYKKRLTTEPEKEKELVESLFAFLEGKSSTIPGLPLPAIRSNEIIRQWQLKSEDERLLLRHTLPRFELQTEQLKRILGDARAENGIVATLPEIAANPYLLTEQFVGSDQDDIITFNKIDHGMFPSPELGGTTLAAKDDWRRLRALCVERLKHESKHSFATASQVIHEINHKLSYLPEWKRHQFTERYLEVDEENLSGALTFRTGNDPERKKYIYLKSVYEAEREVEEQIRKLARRPDISINVPMTAERHWVDYLTVLDSPLASGNTREEYDAAILGQAEVCQKIFVRPLCVLSGAAGTGKTTVIRALLQGIRRTKGSGVTIQLLAPTGKAADIMREKTGEPAATIHSFLAQRGWLNENMTFKRKGGRKEEAISTYIIDEASMLDLELIATLFRAINWATVQRLIFVGDPNQLPPIGRGKIFADLIDWIRETNPESLGFLEINIRQMENRLKKLGTGILDLASLFTRLGDDVHKSHTKMDAELMLGRVQEQGDIDQDLRVIYWSDPDDLSKKLIETIFSDLEKDTDQPYDPTKPSLLWEAAFKVQDDNGQTKHWQPEILQIISPYRGEQYGTGYLNTLLQRHINGWRMGRVGQLGGITLFDKVIQVVNRPKSNPYWAYSTESKKSEKIEAYNGEIGFAQPDLRDWRRDARGNVPFLQPGFTMKRFQVQFSRKSQYRITLDSGSEVERNLELAYAISVHKSQGSEFKRVYFIVPKHKMALLSREMFYTGITRANRHCTLLVQEDISPLLNMRRPESSHLAGINSSLFDFRPIPEEFLNRSGWYEEGKIHRTLTDIMVRSKSEVILANMLFERDIPFRYEVPLRAPDGTFYLPDFVINWAGEEYYWEHLGMLDQEKYRNHWETKKAWYAKFFPGKLLITEESGELSKEANSLIEQHFS
ncbi:MAG: AAA family ATPase [Chloroflexota bacterium]